ncbi:MAG: hypothetical protein E7375_02325 [Clostridiales bacterium]|nr:hypothetical protein [Clostridiales bacterium]
MLVARNFQDRSVIESLTDGELDALDTLDKEGQKQNRDTYVCLINDNFDNRGRRLFVVVPAKKDNILYYEAYLLDSWDSPPKPHKCINSDFKTLSAALQMADALYGATDLVDEASREYKTRMAIQKQENEVSKAKQPEINPIEELDIPKESFNEIYRNLDEVIGDIKTLSQELNKEPEKTK